MPVHPEERRFAAVVGELIARRATTVETVESRLGWESGRLATAIDGRRGLDFDELLAVLGALETTPAEFFARLGAPPEQDSDRGNGLFGESRRVIREALGRRARSQGE